MRYVTFLFILFGSFYGAGQEKAFDLENSRMLFNGTVRIPSDSWINYQVRVSNFKEKSENFSFSLSADNRLNEAFYIYDLKLPPYAKTTFNQVYLTGYSDKYTQKVVSSGQRKDDVSSRQLWTKSLDKAEGYIVALSDGSSIILGNLKNKTVNGLGIFKSFSSVDEFVYDYKMLQSCYLLIISKLNVERISDEQIDVIRKYVLSGGTILWSDNETIQEFKKRGLHDILPVSVGGSIQRYNLSPSGKWQLPTVKAPEGIDTLQLMSDSGRMIEDKYGIPLWHEQQVGFGRVFTSSISMLNEDFHSLSGAKGYLSGVINYILQHTQKNITYASEKKEDLVQAQDKMTGIKIVSSSFIKLILFIYVAVVFGLIIMGRLLKKSTLSWQILCMISIAMTVMIFVRSMQQFGSQPSINANVVQVRKYVSGELNQCENFVTLLGYKDQKISVNMNSSYFLRPISSEKKIYKLKRSSKKKSSPQKVEIEESQEDLSQGMSQPLIINVENRRMFIEGMNIRAREQKRMILQGEEKPVTFSPINIPLDFLKGGGNGISIPEVFKGKELYSYIKLPGGLLPLNEQNGQLFLAAKHETEWLALRDFEKYITKHGPNYALVFVEDKVLVPEDLLTSNTIVSGVTLHYLNISIKADMNGQKIVIPNAMFKEIISNKKSLVDPEFKDAGRFIYEFVFPEHISELKQGTFSFKPTLSNRGKNIKFDVVLQIDNVKVPMSQNENGTYSTTLSKKAINELNLKQVNSFKLAINATQIKHLKDLFLKERMNRWNCEAYELSLDATF
ncbi:MAG: hypothetical protein MK193_10715 [Lentisphaeria bacterium]|nr:hypothetical protein [Lentisphaeria bacterium]